MTRQHLRSSHRNRATAEKAGALRFGDSLNWRRPNGQIPSYARRKPGRHKAAILFFLKGDCSWAMPGRACIAAKQI